MADSVTAERLTVNLGEACDLVGRAQGRGGPVAPETMRKYLRDWQVRHTGGSNGVPYEIDAEDLKRAVADHQRELAEAEQARQDQIAQLFDLGDAGPAGGSAGKMTAAEVVKYQDARLKQLQLAKQRGEVLAVTDVRRTWERSFDRLRRELTERLPQTIADELALDRDGRVTVGRLCREAMRRAIDDAKAANAAALDSEADGDV